MCTVFLATVCKTVRPICYRTVVCLSCPVCDVGVLWPNDWMDQDELGMQVGLGYSHIVLAGDPAPPPQRRHPQFSAHICCGQMAGWIKMPLGTEVGLDPDYIVLDGDTAPLPKKGAEPPVFGPYVYCCHDRASQLLLSSCYKSSAVAEMGDRLATIGMGDRLATLGMGRKWGGAAVVAGSPLGPHLTQCGLGLGLPLYLVASSSMQPFGHNCRNAMLLRVGIRLRTIFFIPSLVVKTFTGCVH